ncbi:TetR/AcrR family transcriptional regulator [Cryptosporangium aurantiacum]|uniref:Transcriptional regulator, TetR family n=1 Tax=Cryptosporangium aurantiacum TaxID=134849 RepID=A0A1M7H530_9ACTN|nr:TetR/AcrR family transcriptional regulator [Cryptosporangium aurantiacum]SHM23641.1 transcriptional regulator, TetR family [Cryptosporangium aurantiacum]
MSSPSAVPLGRLQPQKRDAITRAARRVFGRDGYARASIDAIATEAGVSTRTIYKHFSGKEQLFASVLEASATQVADTLVESAAAVPYAETADQVLTELAGVAHALVRQAIDHPEHFAMVRQIVAESTHFPAPVLAAWQEAGPLRVEAEVAGRLRRLADRGLLVVPDLERATLHFMALATAEASPRGLRPVGHLSAEETQIAVTEGVRAFLNGYSS